MTRIDFYLLKTRESDAKYRLTCRLINKAYQMGHQIYLHTRNATESERLDKLLWTFAQSSFIPHTMYDGQSQTNSFDTVIIGHETPPKEFGNTLISLSEQVPTFFSRFERLVELVSTDEGDKKLARERFRFYRDRGYPLKTHEISV